VGRKARVDVLLFTLIAVLNSFAINFFFIIHSTLTSGGGPVTRVISTLTMTRALEYRRISKPAPPFRSYAMHDDYYCPLLLPAAVLPIGTRCTCTVQPIRLECE
jgi:hypothetical protein